jgi:hypothetical protein
MRRGSSSSYSTYEMREAGLSGGAESPWFWLAGLPCISGMQCIPRLQDSAHPLIVENKRVRSFQRVFLPALYTSYPISEIINVIPRSPSGTRKHQ